MSNAADIRASKANRVTWVGFYTNLALTAFKLAAGIFGNSAAMVADAMHSLSDFATDIVVLVCFRIIGKPPDKSHDYGHGKYETLATALIGLALFAVGLGILWTGSKRIWAGLHGVHIPTPGPIALVAAAVSIVLKEWLYRYTARVGREIQSQAVIANAWHHRSDAFSSIGTLIGIGGAMALGEHWHVLDPIAAVVVSVFILKVAAKITVGSVKELTEESLEDAVEQRITAIVSAVRGAIRPHDLRTRRIGNTVAIDLHVCVAPDLSIRAAHHVASDVENALRETFGTESFVSVHIEPDEG
ncbi:MAG: cation diffusion facilitator family transporter [Verrucomicrobia bacterium]|nr:cation diffusion facilitator family transporter [Verrucomicrobiota bacterium]